MRRSALCSLSPLLAPLGKAGSALCSLSPLLAPHDTLELAPHDTLELAPHDTLELALHDTLELALHDKHVSAFWPRVTQATSAPGSGS